MRNDPLLTEPHNIHTLDRRTVKNNRSVRAQASSVLEKGRAIKTTVTQLVATPCQTASVCPRVRPLLEQIASIARSAVMQRVAICPPGSVLGAQLTDTERKEHEPQAWKEDEENA